MTTKKGPTAISMGVIEDVFRLRGPFESRDVLYNALYDACPWTPTENAAYRTIYLKKVNETVAEWEAVQAWNKRVS